MPENIANPLNFTIPKVMKIKFHTFFYKKPLPSIKIFHIQKQHEDINGNRTEQKHAADQQLIVSEVQVFTNFGIFYCEKKQTNMEGFY